MGRKTKNMWQISFEKVNIEAKKVEVKVCDDTYHISLLLEFGQGIHVAIGAEVVRNGLVPATHKHTSQHQHRNKTTHWTSSVLIYWTAESYGMNQYWVNSITM